MLDQKHPIPDMHKLEVYICDRIATWRRHRFPHCAAPYYRKILHVAFIPIHSYHSNPLTRHKMRKPWVSMEAGILCQYRKSIKAIVSRNAITPITWFRTWQPVNNVYTLLVALILPTAQSARIMHKPICNHTYFASYLSYKFQASAA